MNPNPASKEEAFSDTIHCARCAHFTYFPNSAGHNSPHALGKCSATSWDGNTGQWAMLVHHCKHFVKAGTD